MTLPPAKKQLSRFFLSVAILLPGILCSAGCALFRSRVQPYPRGVFFPMIPAFKTVFEGEMLGEMISESERIYFALNTGSVVCWDGRQRHSLWDYQLAEEPASPLIPGKDHLYITDRSHHLHAFLKDGTLAWTAELPGPLSTGVSEGDSLLFAALDSNLLLALELASGNILWTLESDSEIQTLPLDNGREVVFGTADGKLWFVDITGKVKSYFSYGEAISGELLAEDGFLFFGSNNHFLVCFDRNKHRIRWRFNAGAPVYFRPVTHENQLYFISRNQVLYNLDKKSGTVKWWKAIPARTPFAPRIVLDKIIVSSRSRYVVGFDLKSGASSGTFECDKELTANPVWIEPHLVIAGYDRLGRKTELIYLIKEVKAEIKADKTSPQQINEEIKFNAVDYGFIRPEFEFSRMRYWEVRIGPLVIPLIPDRENAAVVKEFSDENEWTWYPDEGGYYLITVKIRDEKENAAADMLYYIEYPIEDNPDEKEEINE